MPQGVITATSYEAVMKISASDDMVAEMNAVYQKNTSGTMPVMGKEGSLNLAQFIGVPLDGSIEFGGETYTWDDLLDQVKFNEMAKLIGQTYLNILPVPTVFLERPVDPAALFFQSMKPKTSHRFRASISAFVSASVVPQSVASRITVCLPSYFSQKLYSIFSPSIFNRSLSTTTNI